MRKITMFFMLFFAVFTYAQNDDDTITSNDVRPYRIGLKIGVPNVASLEFEYLTPLLNNRVAPFANYIGSRRNFDEIKARLNIFELGSNIYISKNNEGRGLYGSISYQNISGKADIQDYEPENNNPDGTIKYDGTSKTKVSYNGINLKFGAKLGRKFFFRTELGYSFGKIPEEVVVKGTYQGRSVQDVYSIKENIEDAPVVEPNGFPIFNLGFGFAF